MGTKQSSIARFESNEAEPSFRFMKKILEALDLSLDDILKIKKPPKVAEGLYKLTPVPTGAGVVGERRAKYRVRKKRVKGKK